jgi:hypothetical protein
MRGDDEQQLRVFSCEVPSSEFRKTIPFVRYVPRLTKRCAI